MFQTYNSYINIILKDFLPNGYFSVQSEVILLHVYFHVIINNFSKGACFPMDGFRTLVKKNNYEVCDVF